MAKRPSNKSRPHSGQKSGKQPGQQAAQRPAPKATAVKTPAGGSRASAASQATKPTGKTGRVSVAQPRPSKPGSSRTQLIIGGVAIVLIIAVVVIGLVINKQQNTVPEEGYGNSKSSVATVSEGVITLSDGGEPGTTIEIFEDALCPICGEFEGQYHEQMAKNVDEGKLAVKLHMLTFLNPQSASGDYSTRASAALLAVANEAGDEPGLAMNFHTKLFENQPQEGGSADLDNDALAALAAQAGAPEAAQQAIKDGKYLDQAQAADTSSTKYLGELLGSVQTPTVLHNQAYVDTREVDWLTNLLG